MANPQASEELDLDDIDKLIEILSEFGNGVYDKSASPDSDFWPLLEKAEGRIKALINQEVQKALSMVEVPEKISMKHAIKTHSDSGAGHTIGFNTAVDQVTTSINKIKEQYND